MFKVTWMSDNGDIEQTYADAAPEKGTVEEYEETILHTRQVTSVEELPEPEDEPEVAPEPESEPEPVVVPEPPADATPPESVEPAVVPPEGA